VKIERGQVKVCLWPSTNRGGVWCPNEATTDALFSLTRPATCSPVWQIEEIGADGAQSYHIIVAFDSIEDMNAHIHQVEAEIMEILEDRSLRARRD